jgi:lambda family phage portal protein
VTDKPRAPQILDQHGNVMERRRPVSHALAGGPFGGQNLPYDAADMYGEHLGAWQPYLWSPDAERNIYRDRIVSRVRDVARNDGWASGGLTRILDSAIGANFRPLAKPDYRALANATGIKAFDAKWAKEFGSVAESNYRTWALDPGRWCDAQRAMTLPQIYYVGFRHKLLDGDAVAHLPYLLNRIGSGRARYATCVQLIDPDRLSNPQMQFDQQAMRGGVKVDDWGVATGYYIRCAHQGDWFSAQKSVTWDLIERETEWGRPVIIHDFDHERAGQHRGGTGILAPVLQRLKMLVKYDGTELDSAVVNAMFAAFIEAPFDHQFVEQALGDDVSELRGYQDLRKDFHDERRIMLGGVRMPTLFPGEKIGTVAATRPATNFRDFEAAVLRNIASGMGLSAQQLSQDWSDVNYSSARAALLEAWKTLSRRRADFAVGFSGPIYGAFLEESMEVDEYPLPAGAPDFMEFRGAYGNANWIGPARGWVDPVAEKQGAVLGLDAGFDTLEAQCAEQGQDYIEVLDQRQEERQAFIERNLPFPVWQGDKNQASVDAMQASKKPQAA